MFPDHARAFGQSGDHVGERRLIRRGFDQLRIIRRLPHQSANAHPRQQRHCATGTDQCCFPSEPGRAMKPAQKVLN